MIIGIIEAVSQIGKGRIGLRTKGKTEEGREIFAKGLDLGKKIFSEAKSCDDAELILLAEYSFINQELDFIINTPSTNGIGQRSGPA